MEKILKELLKYKNEKTLEFNKKISPDTKYDMIGINIPNIRLVAKKVIKECSEEEWKNYVKIKSAYFEEVILQGLIIGYSKKSMKNKIELLKLYLPKIDGWAICDTVVSTLKIKENEKEEFFNYIKQYSLSDNEFEVRFFLVSLLNYYINDKYVKEVIYQCDNIKHEGYYVKMAKAWTLSFVGIKYYDMLLKYLNEKNNLDKFTYNKTLQKMIESYRYTKEQKGVLKEMKIK